MSLVDALNKFRERPEETLVAYVDESSQTKDRFFVVGATYFIPQDPSKAENIILDIETKLREIKAKYSLYKELKWETIPSSPGQYFEGYKAFLAPFLSHPNWYFKCMVVDTSKYPLDHKEIMGGNSLTGYYKFLCVFITHGLMRKKPEFFFDIRMDEYPEAYENSAENLAQMCQLKFEKNNTDDSVHYYKRCEIEQVKSMDHNLLQLTDLLVGAISFIWNGRSCSTSRRASLRRELIEYIEETKGVNLGKPTHADIGRFNIWEFKK